MKTSKFKSIISSAVIPVSFVVALLVYIFVMGDASHFEGGTTAGHPKQGDFLGIIYKGGFIVPILMTLLLVTILFTIERYITIGKAAGTGNVAAFVSEIKQLMAAKKTQEAYAACDKQQGSVANIVKATIEKYEFVEKDTTMSKEQKIVDIQKAVEESTSLELPSLEENLVVIATISSVATLVALLGTVIGMIRAFAAMSASGSPDSSALATGISEALINTAFGIGTAAIAVISYNFFTSKIDKLTYSIDEAGYSIVQTYNATH